MLGRDRAPRSTMEFLFELDAPTGPTSGEIDLRTMPDVAAALDPVSALVSLPDLPLAEESEPPAALEGDSAFEERIAHESVESAESTAAIGDERTRVSRAPPRLADLPAQLPRIVLKPQPQARTTEEQHEQRKRRLIARLVTCRDCFRVLGFLDLPDAERKEVAHLLMGLDEAFEPGTKGNSVAKDPATALANASKEALDRLERLISPIEDKLLALDDMVSVETFNARAVGGKVTAKAIARYGRLLASRRMQAGQRRDRFEWIATLLLTRKRPDRVRELVGPERAAQALDLLVGGLPYKAKEQELEEALTYLGDALRRLATIKDQDAFFESEYFLDVHGYKVSMREQLLCPDFVYVSVAINAQLENCIEQWVHSVERLHNANQLTQEGSPREQIQRRLRQEEDAVANIFGAKARPAPAQGRVEPRRKEGDAKKPAKPKKKKKSRKAIAFNFDWRMARAALMLLVILGAGTYLAFETGVVTTAQRSGIESDKLKAISPLIVRAVVNGSGSNRAFEGLVRRPAWRRLQPDQRRAAADEIAQGLSQLGIKKGRIVAGKTKVIEIEQGLVSYVQAEGGP